MIQMGGWALCICWAALQHLAILLSCPQMENNGSVACCKTDAFLSGTMQPSRSRYGPAPQYYSHVCSVVLNRDDVSLSAMPRAPLPSYRWLPSVQVFGISLGAGASSAAASHSQPVSLEIATSSACGAAADSLTGQDSVYIASSVTGMALTPSCWSHDPRSSSTLRSAL